jgi:hypothetical protein
MDGSKVEALRMLEAYEEEVGSISESLRIPVRTWRRVLSASTMPSFLGASRCPLLVATRSLPSCARCSSRRGREEANAP